LKLARSSVIYFVQMVFFRERGFEKQENGLVMPLTVPSHRNTRDFDE
jgi:hypothetical protein